jgi:hypothetical protein
MRICFDMDGTIADLYGVDGWLDDLTAKNTRPYAEAKVLVRMCELARQLNRLQKAGHEIVIISWLARNSSEEYDKAVTEVKKAWLAKHLRSVRFDEINIVQYGYNKANFAHSADDVLFDDEEKNRTDWTGKAYGVENILEILKKIS